MVAEKSVSAGLGRAGRSDPDRFVAEHRKVVGHQGREEMDQGIGDQGKNHA